MAEMFKSSVIKTDVTAVKLVNGYVFAGVGNYFHILDQKGNLLKKIKIFDGQKIYGIEIHNNDLLLYGGCHVVTLNFDLTSLEFTRLRSKAIHDWILTGRWLKNREIAVVIMSNKLIIVNENLDIQRQVICEEKCILYSAFICYNGIDELVILSGTVFSEIIVWKVNQSSSEEICSVSTRLKGHKGVIFSVSYNETSGYICSSSDDRSTILWSVENRSIHNVVCNISLKRKLYGHQSRVFRSLLLDDFVITAGEDSNVIVWNYEGHLIRKIATHQGGPVWALDYSGGLLVSGGGDAGVLVSSLQSISSSDVATLPQNKVPRRIGFLCSGNLIVVTEDGCVFYYVSVTRECLEIAKHDELRSYSVLEVSRCRKLVSLSGYKFFVEGYIQDVRLHEVELVLKRKCHHSQKKNVKPHSLWFKFTTEPLSIIEAHCSCEVGLSQSCHHLVGLAYYLQDCVLRGHQELSDAPSSTSQAKQWKKPRGTKVIPESVLTTVFYNPTNTKPHKKPVMPRMQVPRVSRKEATLQETIKQFKQAIKQINNNAAMAYILDDSVDADDEMTTFQLHARVRAGTRQVQMPDSSRPFDLPIITSNTTNILIGQPLPPVEDMTLQQCIDLETRTRDQRSSEWHEARRFRFTSSSFGLLCKRKKDFSKEFFETLWSSSQQVQNVPAVQHGRKEETNAITLYMEESGNQVKRCGLVVHPYAPHLGTSPDGVVKTPNGEIGVLEVKCPYTKKATSFKEYLRLKTSHLEEDQNKEICLKFSHNYYYQVQGQMLLTGARWCDFCTYFKHFNHVNIVRVEFDEPFCVEMYRQLTNIYNIYLTL